MHTWLAWIISHAICSGIRIISPPLFHMAMVPFSRRGSGTGCKNKTQVHDRRSVRFLARWHTVNGRNTQLQHCFLLYTTSTAPHFHRHSDAESHVTSPHNRAHCSATCARGSPPMSKRDISGASKSARSIYLFLPQSPCMNPSPYASRSCDSRETANGRWITTLRWMPPLPVGELEE
jgi:hypothetical protein